MIHADVFRLEGAVAGIAAGALLFIVHLLNLIFGRPAGNVAGLTCVLVAHLLLVFSFAGLYSSGLAGGSLVGRAGMIVGIIGTILVTGIVLIEIGAAAGVDTSRLAKAVVLKPIHLFGPLGFVVGIVLFGVAVMMSSSLPIWGGLLLIVGTVVFALGSVFARAGLVLSSVGALLTGAGFIWLSIALL